MRFPYGNSEVTGLELLQLLKGGMVEEHGWHRKVRAPVRSKQCTAIHLIKHIIDKNE